MVEANLFTWPAYGSYQPAKDCEWPNYNQNKEEQEENTDGWENAHKKHHNRPQKKVHMDHWSSYKRHPSELEYSEEVSYASEMDPSDEDLDDHKKACAKLWELDFNCSTPCKDYEVDVGEGKRVHDAQDIAEANLFTWEEQEENTDGWETAHQKHHNRPQKKVHMGHWSSYKHHPSEQEYSEVGYASEMDQSDEDLDYHKKACANLWELDFNHRTPGKDYEIDVGEGKRVRDAQDMAEANLFAWPAYGSYQPAEDCEWPNYNQNKEEREENTDGWETAHKKHHNRPQKKVHMDHWSSYKCHPSEQEYSKEVSYASEMDPSDEDLDNHQKACAKLWELDFNHLTPGKDHEIDVAEGKRVHDAQDMAGANLFTWPAYGSDQPAEDCKWPNYNQNKEEQDENTDGWETARKNHHDRPQKKVHMDHWSSYKRHPNEQECSEGVSYASEMDPSDEDLDDYKKACAKLWELDFNRLTPGKDYEIDVGEGKRVHDAQGMVEANLFTWVSEEVLRKPTISRFLALLDNYNPHEGCKAKVTAEEIQEQTAFIDEISRTAPIKYLYKYLNGTGIFTENYEVFKRMLKYLWFTLYSRGGTAGSSSSFEHIFVGEIKDREQVSGFHNWLQFYLEEAEGRVEYQGYILPRRHGQLPDSETQLLTVQFEWNGVLKSLSSMFVGVSPEFELALYTLCFFARREDNHMQVGPYPVNIKCYRLGNKIGSAFPIAES